METHRERGNDVVPGAPGDNTTMSSVLEEFARLGFRGSWHISSDPGELQLVCEACGRASSPSVVPMDRLRRLEGASDPSDMAALAGLTCPHCGTKGVLIVMFGPESSAAEADVLRALDDRRYHGGSSNPQLEE